MELSGIEVVRIPRGGEFVRGEGKGFKIGEGMADQDNGSSGGKAREEGNGGRRSVLPGRVTVELELAFGGEREDSGGLRGLRGAGGGVLRRSGDGHEREGLSHGVGASVV